LGKEKVILKVILKVSIKCISVENLKSIAEHLCYKNNRSEIYLQGQEINIKYAQHIQKKKNHFL